MPKVTIIGVGLAKCVFQIISGSENAALAQDYHIRYIPSDQPSCFNFVTQTVTDRGRMQTGQFCRRQCLDSKQISLLQ